jgi:hypothetical protein
MKSLQVLLLSIFFVNAARAAEKTDALETQSFTLASVIGEALRDNASIKRFVKWTAEARGPQAA